MAATAEDRMDFIDRRIPATAETNNTVNARTAAIAATAEDGRDFNNSCIPATAEKPTSG